MNEPRMPALLTSSGRPGFYFRSKLHLFLVSTLKASRGNEEEFQACGDRLLHAVERSPDK
jgi:hypothetical protein